LPGFSRAIHPSAGRLCAIFWKSRPEPYEKEQAKIKAQGWGGRLLWHYDFLRALDYFQSIRADYDERMKDAMELLKAKQPPQWSLGCL